MRYVWGLFGTLITFRAIPHSSIMNVMVKYRFSFQLFSLLLLVLAVGAGCSGAQNATRSMEAADLDVVALFAGQSLILDAFEERYARTVGSREAAADDSLAAYQDFLERYVNFRLKVLAAREAGLHEDSALQREILDYRANLARPYLLEQEVVEPIVRDLYEKRQEMIDASHILLRVEADAAPGDTLAAYNKLTAIADSIRQGADFGEMAARHSEDPSAQRPEGNPGHRGRLGFFSAGRMVEAFEEAAYDTPVDSLSAIIRTQFGYHLLYVHARKPAQPDVRVAHIMMQPEGQTAEDSASVRAQLENLKAKIAAGADFGEFARQYSIDPSSKGRGGDVGWIRADQPLVASFKDVAFALENEGDLSEIVLTPYGYHLIQLLDRKKLDNYEASYEELKKEVARLPRAQRAEQQFAEAARARRGGTIDTAFVLQQLAGVSADSIHYQLVSKEWPAAVRSHHIATLGDSTYTFGQLRDFAQTHRFQRQADPQAQVVTIVEQFLNNKAIDYEAAALEGRNEEFRQLMDEFRDGLLLFRLMEDSVWTAAAEDTVALEAYYEAHAGDYRFPERTRLIEFYSPSDSALQALDTRLASGASIAALAAELAADTLASVRLDTMLVAGRTESIYDRALALSQGERTAVLPYQNGHLLLVHDGMEAARPKTFAEARTEVTSDYQQVLEDRLIARLRDRYDVRTFPERLTRAFAGEAAPATSTATQ